MKTIFKKLQDKIANFSDNLRRDAVEEIADTIIDTLTMSKSDRIKINNY